MSAYLTLYTLVVTRLLMLDHFYKNEKADEKRRLRGREVIKSRTRKQKRKKG